MFSPPYRELPQTDERPTAVRQQRSSHSRSSAMLMKIAHDSGERFPLQEIGTETPYDGDTPM
jgi:hypothetical protein